MAWASSQALWPSVSGPSSRRRSPCLTLLGFLLQPIPGELVVIEQPSFYGISGSSADDLRAAMSRLGPRDSEGERHDALTDWTVRWDYRYRPLSGVCYLTSFTTTLTVDTTLPKWESERADASLRKRWGAFRAALEEHESGHAGIGQRAARAIQEKAAALTSARTCPAMLAVIESTSETILARHRKENAEYDRRTQHGLSGCAVSLVVGVAKKGGTRTTTPGGTIATT